MPNTTAIDPNLTMRELLGVFPGAQRALFRKYHIGGCSSCGFRPDETLAQVCARNDALNVDEVIGHIQASHESDLKIQIAPGELADALKSGRAVSILDVRTREEFDTAKIEGARFFTQELMQEVLAKYDRAELLVVVDHHGTRSMD